MVTFFLLIFLHWNDGSHQEHVLTLRAESPAQMEYFCRDGIHPTEKYIVGTQWSEGADRLGKAIDYVTDFAAIEEMKKDGKVADDIKWECRRLT